MFGNYPFGEYIFGGNDVYVPPSTDTLPFRSISFIPPAIAGDNFFVNSTNLIDYITKKYHYDEIKKIAALYNIFDPNFDADTIIKFLGGSGFIVVELTDEQKRGLCLLLSSLYELKGLRKAVEALLSSIGIPGYLYEKWEIDYELETGLPSREDTIPIPLWDEIIEKCSIAIVLDATGKLIYEGIEDNVREALEYMLWVCARLNTIVWLLDYRQEGRHEDFEFTETIRFEDYMDFCAKVFNNLSTWCFLPKPIVECNATPIYDRKIIFFKDNDGDIPLFQYDSRGNPIIFDYDGNRLFGYNDEIEYGEYDEYGEYHEVGDYYDYDEYFEWDLTPWKVRPKSSDSCCDDEVDTILFYQGDHIYADLYETGDILVLGEWDFETLYTEDIVCSEIMEDGHFPIFEEALSEMNVFDNSQIKVALIYSDDEDYDEYDEYDENWENVEIELILGESIQTFYLIKKTDVEGYSIQLSLTSGGDPLSKEEFMEVCELTNGDIIKLALTQLPPSWRE